MFQQRERLILATCLLYSLSQTVLLGVIPQASELVPLWEHFLTVCRDGTLPNLRGFSVGSGRQDASTLALVVKLFPCLAGGRRDLSQRSPFKQEIQKSWVYFTQE